jgi:hypothetical protein
MPLADLSQVLAGPWAGVGGFAVGFVVGARYRITKRNGGDH